MKRQEIILSRSHCIAMISSGKQPFIWFFLLLITLGRFKKGVNVIVRKPFFAQGMQHIVHDLRALHQIDEHRGEYRSVHGLADQERAAERKLPIPRIKEEEAQILQGRRIMDVRVDLRQTLRHEVPVFLADIKGKHHADAANVLICAQQDPHPEMMLAFRSDRQLDHGAFFRFCPLEIVHLPFVQQIFQTGQVIQIFLCFLFVDIFDTLGTLIGVATKADMLDEEGRLPGIKPALMADAIGTTVGAVMGTSTITTFVESASGVAVGGRTGLTALTTGLLFLASMFFAPIFTAIPSFATAPALMMVGYLMVSTVTEIRFDEDNMAEAIPAYLAIVAMPLFYSISEGISMGIISYVVLHVLSGKGKQVKPLMYVLAVLFVLKYIFL